MIEILLVAILMYIGVIIYSTTQPKYWYFTYIYVSNGKTFFGGAVSEGNLNVHDTINYLEEQGIDTPIILNYIRISRKEYNKFKEDERSN